jgi:hypothetical protein
MHLHLFPHSSLLMPPSEEPALPYTSEIIRSVVFVKLRDIAENVSQDTLCPTAPSKKFFMNSRTNNRSSVLPCQKNPMKTLPDKS